MSKDPVIARLDKALSLEKEGQIAKAVAMAKTLWEENQAHPASLQAALIWARAEGSNPEAIYAVSMSYLLQGQFQEALQGMSIVTKMQPNHAPAFAMAGIAMRSLGDLQAAVSLTQKALELDPTNTFAITNMIDTMYDQGDFENGLKVAIEGTKKYPNDAGLHSNAARLFSKSARHDEAIAHHERVVQLLPNNAGLRVNYLGYLWENKNYDLIPKQLDKAYTLFKDNISAQRMHGMSWLQVKYMHAMHHHKILEANDRLLKMWDMDRMDQSLDSLKLVDKSHPAWLFKAKDLKCYTTDWAYYDDHNIFMNHKVTGQFFVFLMGYGIHGNAYIKENYPSLTIEEECLMLGSVDNYYHWLIDYLPRLAVLEHHSELKNLPIYMSERTTQFQWDTLAHIGITRDRIKLIPQNHIALLKNGYIAHIPGRPMLLNGEPVWMAPTTNTFNAQWLREKFLADIPDANEKKRYFISRENAQFRRCINEANLFKYASEYGFEKLFNEGKTFQQQVASYACADAIIGPHGAGFTNMVFAPTGTKIIEMFPKNRTLDFYKEIAGQLDQPYTRLQGLIQRTFRDKGPDFGDFLIDEDEFKSALDKIV
jgi:tetratricopeptide (TPR) repeat protein